MGKINWKVESIEVHTPAPYTTPDLEVSLTGIVDGYIPCHGKIIDDISRDIEAKLNHPVEPKYVPYSRMSDKYYIRNDAEPTVKITPCLSHTIKNVIFNDPATIVFWGDGTKTVVKCGEDDIFDPEKGLAIAIAKKSFGNQGNYYNEIKKWVAKEDEHEKEMKYLTEQFEEIRKKIEAISKNGFR